MDLIPLPKEKPECIIKKIRQCLKQRKFSNDENFVKKTYLQLKNYLKDPDDFDLDGVNKLLNNLERSIIRIQRHKKKLVEEANWKIRRIRKR